MNKLIFITLLLCSSAVHSQMDFLVFKKRNKQIAFFKKDSYVAFQLKSKEWITGYITKVQNDSFYVKPFIVHYTLTGADTVYYEVNPVAISDVFAMPRKGELFNYTNDHATIIFGNEHWVWIKNGWLFMITGGGYTALNITNSLIKNESPFIKDNISRIGIAAAVFFIGGLLHVTYKPVLRFGRKYHLQFIKTS
jgi:hypothetical protein